jgi:ribosomal protein S12 methylthiotransferase
MTTQPPPPRKKVALIHLGCAKNLVDSEVMLGHLHNAQYGFVRSPADADIVIVNTCGFIRPARDEAEDVLGKLARLKTRRPEKRFAVTGCYVAKERDHLKRTFPWVDAWLGVGSFDRIVDAVEGKPVRERGRTFLYDHRSPRLISTPHGWAYLKVSEGCSHRCSFCSIPRIKGPYRSRGLVSIVEEARAMAGRGFREIDLISQDTTFYGRDRGLKDGLVRLIRRLTKLEGIEWVRILYGYPEEVTDGLLEVLGEPKVCPYLDIPFQHADPGVVRKMKRGSDGERALKLIDKIRKKVPDIALRTSLIVGFPGEGAKEFLALKQFVLEARFHHLGVFTYSPEPGTAAKALIDPLAQEEKDRRRDEIMEMQAGISMEHNRDYVGRTLDVLLEGPLRKGGGWAGRTRYQAPEVDGLVMIEDGGTGPNGRKPIVKVEITDAEIYDLRGQLVP